MRHHHSVTEEHRPSEEHAVTAFLAALAIFVRHSRAYPPGHPVVVASGAGAAELLARALEKEESLTVGVAKKGLFIGKTAVEGRSRQFEPFATLLHDHGIATMTFTREAVCGDLGVFADLLGEQPARLWAAGGPERFLDGRGVSAIRVTRVSSAHFRLREGEETGVEEAPDFSLWEALVRTLTEEGIAPGTGGVPDAAGLARLLSAADESGEEVAEKVAAAQRRFLAALPPRLNVYSHRSMEKLVSFVRELSPRLRTLFLANLFGSSPDRVEFVDALANELPNEAIIDALKATETGGYVPPMVQRLMARLAAAVPESEPAAGPADPETAEKIRLLLQPDRVEKYVPEPYRATLSSILGAESLPGRYLEEIRELMPSVAPRSVEARFAAVILDLAAGNPQPGMLGGLERNLREVADSLLAAGDFVPLTRLAARLDALAAHPPAAPLVAGMRRHFASQRFTTPLFDSLSVWGKEKRAATTEFITKIGPFIVPALLDRLAVEENMSLRRYYMDRLAHLGTVARDAAIARLGDRRWFFVRNIIILLRLMNDPVGIEKIRGLATHPHPRIREEVLKTFQHRGDAIGEEILLRELGADDRDRVLNAIRMAASSRSGPVLERLLEMLEAATSRFMAYDLELKTAIVATLATIGSPAAIPHLDRVLRSRNLLRPVLHRQLKIEIVKSLERYGTAEARGLLERIGRSRRGKPARQAASMLQETWRPA